METEERGDLQSSSMSSGSFYFSLQAAEYKVGLKPGSTLELENLLMALTILGSLFPHNMFLG